MSKKFKLVNRHTGESWKPRKINYGKQYVVMYDSGYPAIVTEDFDYTYISPVDMSQWELIVKENLK